MVCAVLDTIDEAAVSGGRFGEMMESSEKLKSLTCGKLVGNIITAENYNYLFYKQLEILCSSYLVQHSLLNKQ